MWLKQVFWKQRPCVMCLTLVCITVDKKRVTDALEGSPRTKGCSGLESDGNVPVWHPRTSNYPAWRPLPLSRPTPPSKSHNGNRLSPFGGDRKRHQLRTNNLMKRIRACFCHVQGSPKVSYYKPWIYYYNLLRRPQVIQRKIRFLLSVC